MSSKSKRSFVRYVDMMHSKVFSGVGIFTRLFSLAIDFEVLLDFDYF
jgi:hypothetical protein